MTTYDNVKNGHILETLTSKLNPPQREAVLKMEGPLLILAGAGSGKTRVLTHRLAAIVASGKAAGDEILCVTFTNKAAREMESRIYQLLSDLGLIIRGDLWINTFHSFCVRILKKHLTLLDYKPFFTIYDSSDQLSQLKRVCQQLNINDKIYPAKNFQSRISFAKMNGLTPETLAKGNRSLMDLKTLEVFRAYEMEMKKANALDFDDLLLKTHELFVMYPDLLKEYQQKFKFIMVDEYQDTNHIQYLIVKLLAQAHRNLCVVGDEDQSIYSWRGADIKNILDFEQDFTEAKVVKLEENYRSTHNIVQAATAVIKNNSQRKDKTLFTNNKVGELIYVQEERNEYDEAKFVVKTIQTMINEGEGTYQDYAIFYRTNAQSRVLEEQLRTSSIPYRLVGGVRFYERMEIKDILGYLKLSLNPADDLAAKRIINVPTRGIGKTTVEKIEALGFESKLTFLDAIQKAIDTKIFNAGTTSKLRRFLDLVIELRDDSLHYKLNDFYHLVLEKSEYLKALKAEDTTEAEARIQNLEEFDNAIAQFIKERGEESSLQTFLEEMALVSDADQLNQEVNSVTLMTLHISKGLEFPYVFIVGLEESLFPSLRGDDDSVDDMEEERRLAYVGMTRARVKLFLTYARTRKIWGQDQTNPPSRFLKEIPKELVNFKATAMNSFFQKYGQSHFNSQYSSENSGGFYSEKKSSKGSDFDFESQSFPDEESYSANSGRGKSYAKGMRVKHPTFGIGSVFETEGSGEMLKVSVLFSDQTIKKFVVKYARLEIV
ncbi:MAG: UvrD-helicase domain-containing protein [Bdellovibrionaceae bacterium]|nr:UvrD-helicase domain-containing protein [Pseudobdellovibrionaceae bacterium]NUM57163.1 UvrD-helicase domain-containing protein [Pseudobdellovibrionaceae bacterium]